MRPISLSDESIAHKVDNFRFTLTSLIKQLQEVPPHCRVYKGKGDRWNYDPSGLIERIALRLSFAFTQKSRVGEFPDGLYFEAGGSYDHTPVQKLLENADQVISQQTFKSMRELKQYYERLRSNLWKLRLN
jgi:hypothetical protein